MRPAVMPPAAPQITRFGKTRSNNTRLVMHFHRMRQGMNGLGYGGEISNEPVALPVSQATPDSSFDWSKVISSALTAGGAITSNVLTGRYAVAVADASRPNVVMAPTPAAPAAPLVSNKTLIIGGVAVVGILALALMLRK
jgi:hypothetical protein